MEKRTPLTRLSFIHSMVRAGNVAITHTALAGGATLGFTAKRDFFDVVLALSPRDFEKSMTAYHDHTLWHEVYRPVFNGQSLYIKLIVHSGVLIVSFKES